MHETSRQRWLRALFWAAVVFTFVMAVHPKPPSLPLHPNDKIQHIMAFTALSLFAPLAYRSAPLTRIGAALFVFGALIEAVQAIPVLHRDAQFLDWVADASATTLVLGAIALWRRLKAET